MSRLYVGLPPTKLLLRFTEQLLAQHIVSVETMFPSQALLSAVCIIYVSRVITYSRVWINRVSLPILLVVVPVTGAAILQFSVDQLMCASIFPYPLSVRSGHVERRRKQKV